MLLKRSFDGVQILSVETNSLKEKLRRIVEAIKRKHPEVRDVILFGSFVKNQFTPVSDVDVAIIVTDKKIAFGDNFKRFLQSLRKLYNFLRGNKKFFRAARSIYRLFY